MNGFHVCSFSDSRDYTIRAGVEEWRFDWSDQFGPTVIGSRGGFLAKQPAGKSRFWRATTLWARQGKRLDDAGICVWDELPKWEAFHLYGRTYVERSIYEKLKADGKVREIEPTYFDAPL